MLESCFLVEKCIKRVKWTSVFCLESKSNKTFLWVKRILEMLTEMYRGLHVRCPLFLCCFQPELNFLNIYSSVVSLWDVYRQTAVLLACTQGWDHAWKWQVVWRWLLSVWYQQCTCWTDVLWNLVSETVNESHYTPQFLAILVYNIAYFT